VQRTISVCDLHDREDVAAVESATVRLRGHDRVLDLCAEHAEKIASLPDAASGAGGGNAPADPRAQAPAVRAQRPSSSGKPPHKAGGRGKAAGTLPAGQQPGSRRSLQRERAAVREWARRNGRDVGDKGRLPSGLVEEYRRKQGATA